MALIGCATGPAVPVGAAMRTAGEGLEVIRWTTIDQPARLEGAVIGFQKRPAMNPLAAERLRGEGFVAAIVPQPDVPMLRERISSGMMDIRTDYGTLPSWRKVFERALPAGQAIAVNGRPRAVGADVLQIEARGWSTPTETGGCFQLEIVSALVPAAMVQEALLARSDRPPGTVVPGTGIECCLEAGEALILMAANPGPVKSGRGPGAEGPLPPTAGQFLLAESADFEGRETPMKGFTLLVFVPHLPAGIQPAPSQPPAPE